MAATAALLCALVVSFVVAVAPAMAEEGDSAPIRPVSDGGFSVPEIIGATAPEEYPLRFTLGAEQRMRLVGETEVVVENPEGTVAFIDKAPLEHAADGANVPTTLRLSEGDVVTIIVHHRAGNPAAGGAPFAYPISNGPGWEGGYRTFSSEMNEPKPAPAAPVANGAPPTAPIPVCTVPTLKGLSLRAAKARLRAGDCTIGPVRRAPGATAGKGEVVKQSSPAGTQLAAGAPVAIKLGPR